MFEVGSELEYKIMYRILYYYNLPSLHPFIFNSKNIIDLKSVGFETIIISRYMARKFLKKWENDGLIVKAHYGGQDEDGYIHCINGYSSTNKLLEMRINKLAKKHAMEEFKKCWE